MIRLAPDLRAKKGRAALRAWPCQPIKPAKTKPDADRDSLRLRLDHELLWTKNLRSGVLFAPTAPSARRDGYPIFTDTSGARHWCGSDAITASYTGRVTSEASNRRHRLAEPGPAVPLP